MDNYTYVDVLGRTINIFKKNDKVEKIITSLFRSPHYVSCEALKIGVLGDLHGHISLGLRKLADWQNFSGHSFDAILQVGDFGIFDKFTSLDKVTLEMSKKDPDELGFKDYHIESEIANQFFGECGHFSGRPLYFIAGNHDDPSLLAERNISFYPNLNYIPNGKYATISKNGLNVNVGALGDGYTEKDIKNLALTDLDILLTHYPPKSVLNSIGDEVLGGYIDSCFGGYTFFGHIHSGAPQITLPFKKQYGLGEVRIKSGKLKLGGLGYLQFSGSESFFFYLPEEVPK